MKTLVQDVPQTVEMLRAQLEDAIVHLPSHLVTNWAVDEACRKLCAAGYTSEVRAVRARLASSYVPFVFAPTTARRAA